MTQKININTFLKDTFKAVMNMMRYVQQPSALLTDKDDDGRVKSGMYLFYFDDPKHNEMYVEAIKEVSRKIDGEEE